MAAPSNQPGIFMGYKILPGGKWHGEYRVCLLSDFDDVDLSMWGDHEDVFLHTTKEVVVDRTQPPFYPLKAKYDHVRQTVKGTP